MREESLINAQYAKHLFTKKVAFYNIYQVKSLTSEATHLTTPFFKRAYKISHLPQLWVSWIDLPSFASSSKIWPNFSNKVFFSWSYEKVILTKNVRLSSYSSMKKKIRKIWMIFDIENSLWKSNLAKLGKASQNAHNPGGWLIL